MLFPCFIESCHPYLNFSQQGYALTPLSFFHELVKKKCCVLTVLAYHSWQTLRGRCGMNVHDADYGTWHCLLLAWLSA